MNSLSLGIFNGWIFFSIFLLVNLILIFIFPKHFSKRLFAIPYFNSKSEAVPSVLYAFLFNSTMIYSIFVPIQIGSLHSYIGISLFFLSIIFFIIALINYATTSPNKPVTKGVYKISRHPQQIFAIMVWMGCGVATSSFVIILSCIMQSILLYPSMIAQERFCIEKYGIQYENYIKKTARYFLIF